MAGSVADLSIGTALPDLVRTLDSVSLVAYAGATWDWYRTHHDLTAATEVGLPAPVVDGQQLGALLAAHALAGAPAGVWPVEMDFRFRGMVFAGETVTVSGRVSDVDDDTGLVTVTQRIDTDAGTTAISGATTVLRRPGGSPDA